MNANQLGPSHQQVSSCAFNSCSASLPLKCGASIARIWCHLSTCSSFELWINNCTRSDEYVNIFSYSRGKQLSNENDINLTHFGKGKKTKRKQNKSENLDTHDRDNNNYNKCEWVKSPHEKIAVFWLDLKEGTFRENSSYVMFTRHAPKTKWQGKPKNRQMETEKPANASIKEVKKNTYQTA